MRGGAEKSGSGVYSGMRYSALALASLLIAVSLEAQTQTRYSLDDWLSITSVSSFAFSPDGATLYYAADDTESGTTEIFRVPLAGGEPERLSSNAPGTRPEPKQQMTLSPDGRFLYYASARYFQNFFNLYRIPANGGEPRALTFNDAVIETSPAPSPDGRHLAYFSRTTRGTKILLLDLEAENAWPRPLMPGEPEDRAPLWSPDGSKLAFARGGDIWIHELSSAASKRLVEEAHAGGNGSPAWSPDGERIAFLTSKSGYPQVGIADVATGRVTAVTFSPREHSDPTFSPDGESLAFIEADETGFTRQVVVAKLSTGEQTTVTRGRGIRESPAFAPDGRTLAFIEATPTRSADVWQVPVGGGEPRPLTRSMGRMASAPMSDVEHAHYPSLDNLPIPTLVYKPWGFDPGRKYPVIVRLHGHPGQWNDSFYPEWQYFLSKGFVVVAPNPRGSRGFGDGFHDLHIADYGGTELQDVLGVLDYLEGLGYVDMTRKATWGGSGGGYMSLVIATEAPEAFEAQVIRAPVSSWKVLAIDRFGAQARAWTPTRTPRRERSEFGGSYDEIPEEYDRRSPLNYVEKVRVPQLLFHGLRDSSVLPRQSQLWAERMRELGKGELLDYVELPDEDHGLKRYKKTVRERLERMERFFEKHLRLGAPRSRVLGFHRPRPSAEEPRR